MESHTKVSLFSETISGNSCGTIVLELFHVPLSFKTRLFPIHCPTSSTVLAQVVSIPGIAHEGTMLRLTHSEGDDAGDESSLDDETQMAAMEMQHVPGRRVEAFLQFPNLKIDQ